MAGKKKVSKKKVAKSVAKPKAPKAEPTPPPAIVEEATIRVRGAGMGGSKLMTPTEYAKFRGKK